ncbi:MAG: hypothetical protein HY318_12110, partial [Armatimonadetes bacterium]|nr:hypothetical protein [Armatimonadota bacterium]
MEPMPTSPTPQPLPQVPFGPVSISRLILGGNPTNGGSHLSNFVNRQMKEYFTPENVQALLRRCEGVGINTWQSSGGNWEQWHQFLEAGGRMHYVSLACDDPNRPNMVEELAAAGAVGIAHHGELTDSLFKAGRLDEIRDFLKRVRDSGVQVGVSTHIPSVIETIEEKGWDIDFYMACVYERHRTAEELEKLLGHVPIPEREVYLTSDPPRMCKAIRGTSRTCLAFKILAAGRLCDSAAQVEEAFRFTFTNIKPTDAVIVGMYPEYSDQPAENAE